LEGSRAKARFDPQFGAMVGRSAKRLAIFAALAAAFAFAYACTVTNDLVLVSADGGFKGPGCRNARPPGPPGPTGGAKDAGIIQVATLAVSTGTRDQKLGFDLDNRCTCTPDDALCKPRSSNQNCDDDAGRDNAVADLFDTLTAKGFDTIAKLNERIGTDRGILFEIGEYNGEADDDTVTLQIYGSVGLLAPGDGGIADAGLASDAGIVSGATWTIDERSVGAKSTALNANLQAYVRGGTVVAEFTAGLELDLETNFRLKLKPATVVGKLGKDGASTTLTEVVIAGHWNADDMYRAVRAARTGGKPVCTQPFLNPTIVQTVCSGLDLPNPGAGANEPCGAGSFAIRLATIPARFGKSTIRPTNVEPYACDDAGLVCP
jgi:hypothetical protein